MLSTSVSIKVPVAVGVPTIALPTPLASVTEPAEVPVMMAALLVPVKLTTKDCVLESAPSLTLTVNESLAVTPAPKAFTLLASGTYT